MEKDVRIAVLIDGDNIPSAYVTEMMEEIAKYGNPTVKRIYGDWTNPKLNKWKKLLLENAITPIQQYGYTVGKNATDSAMIIDAMDILTPNPFIVACDKFIYIEILKQEEELQEAAVEVSASNTKTKSKTKTTRKTKKNNYEKITPKVVRLISTTISDCADEDGWAFLGDVGGLIQKKQPT